MAPLAIFSLYTSGTITPSTWFFLCHLDHSISSSDIYPGLSHCAEAVDPISLNNANAKRKAEPAAAHRHPPGCSTVLTRTGPLQDIWFGTKRFRAESVARQEATRCHTFKIKIPRVRVQQGSRRKARKRLLPVSLCQLKRVPCTQVGSGGGGGWGILFCGGWEELENVAAHPQRAPYCCGHSV